MTMVSFVKGRIMKTKIDWAPFLPVVGERHRIVPCTEMTPSRSIFPDGVVEDITMARWRFRWLFVIARSSSFTYKGRTVDVKQVGRELRVRYVPEASVRKAGNRLRISGQLIDAGTGAHLWADSFDGALEDTFDLQDQVAASVVGAIAPKLQRAEIEWAKRKPRRQPLTGCARRPSEARRVGTKGSAPLGGRTKG
jgi:TolB-like protein